MDSTRVNPEKAAQEDKSTPPTPVSGVPYRPPAPVYIARPSPIGEIWKDLLLVALGFLAGFLFGRGTPNAPPESKTTEAATTAPAEVDHAGDADGADPTGSAPTPAAGKKSAKSRASTP